MLSSKSHLQFDGLATHWYGTDASEFQTYMENFHNTFNMDIWVTEYACEVRHSMFVFILVLLTVHLLQNFSGGAQCTEDGVWSFMETTKTWMEETDWIAAYFAFGEILSVVCLLHQSNFLKGVMIDMSGVNDLDRLMADDGTPTDLGYYYINN